MSGEIFRLCWPPLAREVGGRRGDNVPVGSQAFGDQGGVGQSPRANGDVVAVFLQVYGTILQIDLHVDLWIRTHELAQSGGNVAAAEERRGGDLEGALGLAHPIVDAGARHLDFGQNALDVDEEGCALLGDANAPGGTIEQACRQLVLEGLNAFGDGSRCKTKLGADSGQVLQSRHARKNAHILDIH